MLSGHFIAFAAGFILDCLFGDPHWLVHPIRFIGKLIDILDKKLNTDSADRKMIKNGAVMVIAVLLVSGTVSFAILFAAYRINRIAGIAVESIMTYQLIAARCLRDESMKVYYQLKEGNLEGARKAVSMIVGRDTQVLDETGVAKAAIETVAENTSDGVIAPMLYTAIGGPVLGFIYKAVNTMDSMTGYKNDRYLYFGRAAARLDDIVNYVPARISALLMIAACAIGGKAYSAKHAAEIFKRDRYKHASPNSAQTESVCAGALGIRLAGDASYFGKPVKKPVIGDARRQVEYEDIKRANRLMYITAVLCELIGLLLIGGILH